MRAWSAQELVALLEEAEVKADATNPVRPGRKPKARPELPTPPTESD